MRINTSFLVYPYSKMFDFLTDEVFQIVVISALFVIGIVLFMLYKRPSTDVEKLVQFMDDIDYRIDKINKKLDELTNTFVNGLIVDDDDSSSTSGSSDSSGSSRSSSSSGSTDRLEEPEEPDVLEEPSKSGRSDQSGQSRIPEENARNSLNYDGLEFSDIPNFSNDTSIVEEEDSEEHVGKKRATIVKRIIQTEQ